MLPFNYVRSALKLGLSHEAKLGANPFKFGLIGGDIMHGNMSLDQLWAARPMLGHGNYRGPIENLYMCGAGTHPGGGVTGAPGHNAAHEILADRGVFGRLRRWR